MKLTDIFTKWIAFRMPYSMEPFMPYHIYATVVKPCPWDTYTCTSTKCDRFLKIRVRGCIRRKRNREGEREERRNGKRRRRWRRVEWRRDSRCPRATSIHIREYCMMWRENGKYGIFRTG